MNDTAQQGPPAGIVAQSPVTRMWGVIGQLSRTRDAHARSADRESRIASAAEISRLVDQLRGLADALLEASSAP